MKHGAIIFLLAVSLAASAARTDQPTIRVLIDGKQINAPFIQTNGAVYVPVDTISTALGAKVEIISNQNQSQIQITRPPAPMPPPSQPPVPARGIERAGPAIKGLLAWVHDIYKQHEPDDGAQVWLARDEDIAALTAAAGGSAADPIPKRNARNWDAALSDQFHLPRATADVHGLFWFNNAAPGRYTLILRSRHAKDTEPRDRHGKIRFHRVVVRDGETTDVNFNFGRTAYPEEN